MGQDQLLSELSNRLNTFDELEDRVSALEAWQQTFGVKEELQDEEVACRSNNSNHVISFCTIIDLTREYIAI